jgi:hypothetical protein
MGDNIRMDVREIGWEGVTRLTGPMAGCYKHDNEHSNSEKLGRLLIKEQL